MRRRASALLNQSYRARRHKGTFASARRTLIEAGHAAGDANRQGDWAVRRQARFLGADLGNPAEIRRLAEQAGDIDVLVNNAGFSAWGPTADLDVAAFDGMFAANVRAPFYLVAAFAPGMAARGKGSIINISSMAGRLGLPGGAAYGATKAALVSLTQGWTAEFSPRGVRVNAVAPGPV